MQNQPFSAPGPSDTAPKPARQSTNNDANLLPNSFKRLSLHVAANTPLPQSPSVHSPRNTLDPHRTPSSPNLPPSSLRRSPSVASVNRSSSPALGRKSSSSSLRGDMPVTPRPSVSRRSSLNPNVASPIGARPALPQVEEKPPLRACDVAEEYFKKELALHEGITGGATAGTLVLIHDQCYGHRFSRPKTPKSTLNLIVERPERILASVLGISAAYVRLGERHCDGNNPPHPYHTTPERIPFKIRKTSREVDITSPVVTNVHGVKWMEELKHLCTDAGRKLASTGKELVREPNPPNQPRKTEFHEGDLYLCSESLNALQGALGGVLDAVDAVFQGTARGTGPSRAFVCIRPPGHHCSDDHPSGFCWINNVHVGIEHAMMQYDLTHVAIIDFDLHHGDGSQSITWQRNKKVQNLSKNAPNKKKTSIGYFSLHDINSFPCEWGEDDKVQAASLCVENAHGQSVWNIHLESWSTTEEFWKLYEEKYMMLLEKTRNYLKYHTHRLRTSPNHPAPKAAIFLSAGFDASEYETPGMQRHGANVPTEFYARFTQDVVRLAQEEDTGVEGRIISVLEGGYSNRALTSGVLSHLSGLTDGQIAAEPSTPNGLAFDMRQRLTGLGPRADEMSIDQGTPEPTPVSYDPRWWHNLRLTELENLVDPPPPVIPRKPKTGPPPTYSSPTQSFTAKVVDPSKIRRSASGNFMSASPSRAPTPPPPDVDWATATHALSKLLIPSDRQTQSCKPEDLKETKVKKEKPAPALVSVQVDPSGRQLRGRKPATTYADPDSEDEKAAARAASRANRRRTIADLPVATEEPPAAARSVSRRMSIASSIGSVTGERSTSRASSVVPSRRTSVAPAPSTTTNGVQVKKARGTTSTASRLPRNPPPVPRVPSGYLSKTTVIKEKENDMDQLTSGLKRITLKMPTREEHDAREKQRALEAEKKAAGTTTAAKTAGRKAPAARAKSTKAAATTTKKGTGRTAKASKPTSPTETPAVQPLNIQVSVPTSSIPVKPRQTPIPLPENMRPLATGTAILVPAPEPPKTEHVASNLLPLEQPQPIQLEQTLDILPSIEPERRTSTDTVEPPTELREMAISPEDLPKSSFTTMVDPLPLTASPPRPDTPPPPPPSTFMNYTAQTFGTAPVANMMQAPPKQEPQTQAPLQWMPANTDGRPMTPASKRQDLPVFTANGAIPFAPNPNLAGNGQVPFNHQSVGAGPKVKQEDETADIWEVPETPSRQI